MYTNIIGSTVWFYSIKAQFAARMQSFMLFPWCSMAPKCQEHLIHIGNLFFFCQLENSGNETDRCASALRADTGGIC